MGEKKLAEFIKNVDKKCKLEFAVLFGSRARGDNLISSDYDILFVSDRFEKDFFRRIASVLDLWKGPGAVEAVCYTTKEFEGMLKQYNPIAWEVLRDGKVLFGEKKFKKYRKIFEAAVKRKDVILCGGIKFKKEPEKIFGSL